MQMAVFPKIKLAVGLSCVHSVTLWFDFNELLIVRTEFDESFFRELSIKLNTSYKYYVLSKFVDQTSNFAYCFRTFFRYRPFL